MQVDLANNSLEEKIEIVNENLNEIKNMQQKNNSILMKKMSKLYEYNQINDMTNQVFEKRLCNIENLLSEIMKRTST